MWREKQHSEKVCSACTWWHVGNKWGRKYKNNRISVDMLKSFLPKNKCRFLLSHTILLIFFSSLHSLIHVSSLLAFMCEAKEKSLRLFCVLYHKWQFFSSSLRFSSFKDKKSLRLNVMKEEKNVWIVGKYVMWTSVDNNLLPMTWGIINCFRID